MWITTGLFLAAPALADAIPGFTRDCPEGSAPMVSHSGEWCEPRPVGAGCPDGLVPARRGLCTAEVERECGRDSPDRCLHVEVTGPCATDADCATGRCVDHEVCVPSLPPPTAPAPEGGSWMCLTGAVPAGVVGLGLLPLGLRRRRR